jgi:hypothetical protein
MYIVVITRVQAGLVPTIKLAMSFCARRLAEHMSVMTHAKKLCWILQMSFWCALYLVVVSIVGSRLLKKTEPNLGSNRQTRMQQLKRESLS